MTATRREALGALVAAGSSGRRVLREVRPARQPSRRLLRPASRPPTALPFPRCAMAILFILGSCSCTAWGRAGSRGTNRLSPR